MSSSTTPAAGTRTRITSRPCAGRCPQLDQGLAMLLQDLHDRGLLESTLVWCCGEFGRGPKVDWQPPWNGGRNHYGKVFSRPGGRRRIQGRPGGRLVGRERPKRSRTGPSIRSTCWAASISWPASTPRRQAASSVGVWRPTCCPPRRKVRSRPGC